VSMLWGITSVIFPLSDFLNRTRVAHFLSKGYPLSKEAGV